MSDAVPVTACLMAICSRLLTSFVQLMLCGSTMIHSPLSCRHSTKLPALNTLRACACQSFAPIFHCHAPVSATHVASISVSLLRTCSGSMVVTKRRCPPPKSNSINCLPLRMTVSPAFSCRISAALFATTTPYTAIFQLEVQLAFPQFFPIHLPH